MTSGIYSANIDIMVAWFTMRGFEVRFVTPEELPGVMGRIDYDDKLVRINTGNARMALMTLLHEAGHYVAERRAWIAEKPQSPFWLTRELQAYRYGWYVRGMAGIDVITKDDWRGLHEEELATAKRGAFRFMLLDEGGPLFQPVPAEPFVVAFDVPLRFLDPVGNF